MHLQYIVCIDYVCKCSTLFCKLIRIGTFLQKLVGGVVMCLGVVYLNYYLWDRGTNHHSGNQRLSRQGAKVPLPTGHCVVYSQQYQ